jgi:hypothetical protein
MLDDWVASLKPESFPQLLPLLRRTFSTFAAPERRQIGERARRATSRGTSVTSVTGNANEEIDQDRARQVLPLAAQIFGLKYP